MANHTTGGRLSAEALLQNTSENEALDLNGDHTSSDAVRIDTRHNSPNGNQSYPFTWWKRHVRVSVPHDVCRDHFANERTALGYIRTAQAFAMLGVVIAQLMRLQRSENPDPVLGFFVISVPLSAICHIMAVLITCLGCYRFFDWQSNMTRGRALSGGWVLCSILILTFLVLLCIFLLIVIISLRRDG